MTKNFRNAAFTAVVLFSLFTVLVANGSTPPVKHSKVGDKAIATNGDITLTVHAIKQNYDQRRVAVNRDSDIWSPKSVHFHPNGKKYYINSLEGCLTIVYNAVTNKKIKVIKHRFNAGNAGLWAKPSGLFPFKHYKKGQNTFWGRPVESTFSHGGRYLWIPYYRRSYDLNAQDPSAIAAIDTKTDEIIKVLETGPLPKMVATSHNGKHLAVTHWGDNTVGIIDIASNNPNEWHYVKCVAIDNKLTLNFSLTKKVDRDANSGYMLRGTVFTPDDRYMLIACMGGGGGIAVVDMSTITYKGRLTGVHNARHLVVKNNFLYASLNAAGIVQRLPLSKVVNVIESMKGKTALIDGWEKCQVGKGARTVSLSPSGNYAFVACNSASQLCVVDTRTMKLVASLTIDSYPVGLDISNDGRMAVVTSQGRSGSGGNAVNLVKVDYAVAEPVVSDTPPATEQKKTENSTNNLTNNSIKSFINMPTEQLITIGLGIIAVFLIVGFLIIHNRHSDKRKQKAND